MHHQVHIAGRGDFVAASELIERFGDFAASEAAQRAARSRDLGNVVHFCRWRQVERLVALLADRSVTGPVH